MQSSPQNPNVSKDMKYVQLQQPADQSISQENGRNCVKKQNSMSVFPKAPR